MASIVASYHSSNSDKARVVAGYGYDGFEKELEGSCCTQSYSGRVKQLAPCWNAYLVQVRVRMRTGCKVARKVISGRSHGQ
jgi:hypothetical protein